MVCGERLMSFDEVFKLVHPIVVQAAPKACSLGCAKEIAEDVAFLISHGYTLAMARETKARAATSRGPIIRG